MLPDHQEIIVMDSEEFVGDDLFKYCSRQKVAHNELGASLDSVFSATNIIQRLDDDLVGLRCAMLPSPNGGVENYVFIEDSLSVPSIFFSVCIIHVRADEVMKELRADGEKMKRLNMAVGAMLFQRALYSSSKRT